MDRAYLIVADDEPCNLHVLERLLAETYDVRTARNGLEVLDLIASGPRPDLVLSDVMMPELDGFELCRQLKADAVTAEIPILLLTSLNSSADEEKALVLGASDFIHKPFSVPVVLARVRIHMELAQTARLLRDSNGSLSARLSDAASDLARANEDLELRVAERTAELQAANEELEAFSCAVSHDLMSPLRAIHGFSQHLLEECQERLTATERHILGRIHANAHRMTDVVDDLLKLARIPREGMDRREVNLTRLASETIQSLEESAPRGGVSVLIESDMRVWGDEGQLRIALENLLANAWKYTSRTPNAQIRCTMRRVHGQKIVEVSDNGAGFDMSHISRLFQPFQRLHRADEFPGTGLGLATVQRIVRRHGGTIEADAEPGRGATFTVALPDYTSRRKLVPA